MGAELLNIKSRLKIKARFTSSAAEKQHVAKSHSSFSFFIQDLEHKPNFYFPAVSHSTFNPESVSRGEIPLTKRAGEEPASLYEHEHLESRWSKELQSSSCFFLNLNEQKL